MRKLALELDALEVESFETVGSLDERGTVHGHVSMEMTCFWSEETCFTRCVAHTCPECAVLDDTVYAATCPETCADTCG